MTSIRRPWPPALRWAARNRKPLVIRLRALADPERIRVYRMRRQAGAVTWEFVREIPPPKREGGEGDEGDEAEIERSRGASHPGAPRSPS